MQNRLKSWPLWTSIFALIAFCSKMYFGYTIPGVDELVNLILPVVAGLGIVNDPTNSKKF